MSRSDMPSGGFSRPSNETNSVNAATAEDRDFEEEVHERVLEFCDEYPDLAELQLSQTHGRKLRRIVTEAEWSDSWVDPDPDDPTKNAFQVTDLDRRTAATWSDALSAFLTAHTEYKGLMARFRNECDETFEVELSDSWGETYSKKQYAKALALQRQMAGGERPSGGTAVAEWERPATAMVTLTGTSIPDGNRIAPVDFLDALHDSFSYNGVRDALRNTMEYHLGLARDSWGYQLQSEAHGIGAASSDGSPGANACYPHLHIGVYFDASGLDLQLVERELGRVVDKHVEVCDLAGAQAHEDDVISVNADVENMGSYMATYAGGYTESLLEKPIEYLAWGALYWSAARRRTSRSVLVNEAIKADACAQRFETESTDQEVPHGEHVEYDENRGSDVVCTACGSGWSIDQTRLDGPVQSSNADTTQIAADGGDDLDSNSLENLWVDADGAVSIGESPSDAKVRRRVLDYVDAHGPPESIPALMGELSISPHRRDVVEEAVAGMTEPETESFHLEPDPGWDLDAIIDRDGEEHLPGSGGVDMVELHLPQRRILEETRLRHETKKGEHVRCGYCDMKPAGRREGLAYHLAFDHGIQDPEVAERFIVVTDYFDLERESMAPPDPETNLEERRRRAVGLSHFTDTD